MSKSKRVECKFVFNYDQFAVEIGLNLKEWNVNGSEKDNE